MVPRVKTCCASTQVEFRFLELLKSQTWWHPSVISTSLVKREVETGESPETWGLDRSVYTALKIKDKAKPRTLSQTRWKLRPDTKPAL